MVLLPGRKGDEWFIGGINGNDARTLDIRFSFLTPGVKYSAKIYSDDPAVNTRTHVRIDTIEIDNNSVYPAKLGANNGIAIAYCAGEITTIPIKYRTVLKEIF